MISFADFITAAQQADGSYRAIMPNDWRQGRTAYGGFSVALAYKAAQAVVGEGGDGRLLFLRSAQVAFIGPVGEDIAASAHIVRRGKSSAFVEAHIHSEGGLALSAMFLFMADRSSSVALQPSAAPSVMDPAAAAPAMRGNGPAYRAHMEYRHSTADASRGVPELMRWVRLREREGLDSTTELLLIGDALPPGVLPMFDVPPILSSATWTVQLHGSRCETSDGWWLLRSAATSALESIDAEDMAVWNSAGESVMSGSQIISLFEAEAR